MSISDELAEGQYESRKETDGSAIDLVKRWLAEVDLVSSQEKAWRKEADMARQVYRAEETGAEQRFNILFSNIQTAVPALYNSTPNPDVRTRYNDEDEVARISGQAIERVLSYSIDSYPFDNTVKSCVQDRELVGRGAARVRYMPHEYEGRVYQEVTCEHVHWKHFFPGPATRWEDVPWLAFEHFLTREQLMQLNPNVGGGINLDFVVNQAGKVKADAAPNVYKRARIYEIWDKRTRKVLWIAPSYKAAPVRVDDDPLGLVGFFPMPEPLYAIRTSDSLVPICPYRIVKPLVDELEEITVRIQALIRVAKWRGIRHPAIPSFERLEEAQDGELIAPLDNGAELLTLIQSPGGIAANVWLMPVKEVMEVLQALYIQREQVKNTIFEVTGMADIMRGQTDPNETLGAQEIKANFGTMRLQDGQKDVQRFCRDLMRLKAEIACNMFDSQNLAMMTGLHLPSRQDVMMARQQAQQAQGQQVPPEVAKMAEQVAWEDVLETLKSGIMRSYRVDIETDSTIQGDVRKAQAEAGAFLEGTGKFMQAVGPIVQAGGMDMDVAIDLYASMARRFRLGKQAEDALSRMSTKAHNLARNPAPEKPSPEQMKLEFEMKKHQEAMQFEQAKAQQEMQLRQQEAQQNAALKQQEFAHSAKLKEMELERTAELERMKIELQTAQGQAKLQQDQALKMQEFDHQRALADAHTALELQKMDKSHQLESQRLAHDITSASKSTEMERGKFDREMQFKEDQVMGYSSKAMASKLKEITQQVQAELDPIKRALVDATMQAERAIQEAAVASEKSKKPKRIIRDPNSGKAIGVETGHGVYVVERDQKSGRAIGLGEPRQIQ